MSRGVNNSAESRWELSSLAMVERFLEGCVGFCEEIESELKYGSPVHKN